MMDVIVGGLAGIGATLAFFAFLLVIVPIAKKIAEADQQAVLEDPRND